MVKDRKINESFVPSAPTLNTNHIAPNGSVPNMGRSWSGIFGPEDGGMPRISRLT